MPFKDNGRATIIGESTFGSSGQPYVQRFENGMIFRISTKREYFPDGSEFEGRGIRPNVEVHPRAEDLQSGNDVILQKAVVLASQH
jgi:carboxyl-terminal processing protease